VLTNGLTGVVDTGLTGRAQMAAKLVLHGLSR
jgi:hypothetical protein